MKTFLGIIAVFLFVFLVIPVVVSLFVFIGGGILAIVIGLFHGFFDVIFGG